MPRVRLSLLALSLTAGCARPAPPSPRDFALEMEVVAEANKPLPSGCVERLDPRPSSHEDAGTSTASSTTDGGSGFLRKADIRDVIRANNPRLRACYEHVQRRQPDLQGKVTTRFVINDAGEVCAARVQESTAPSPALGQCVLGQLARMRFPPPNGGGIVLVSYPFIFKAP